MGNCNRVSTCEMHSYFISALGDTIAWHSALDKKPLEVDVINPYSLRFRVYMYNCTSPLGKRPKDEYKLQLIVPMQKHGVKGEFDYSDERIVLLIAYAVLYNIAEEGVFVLFDALRHQNFAYSANLQVKADIINQALVEPISIGRKNSGEVIVAAQREHLCEAIDKRLVSG